MSSMNHTILLGGLTRDPELRHTGGGMAICKFSLAVTEVYKDKAGKEVKSTCYVDIDAWGTLGETVAKHLRKGSQALVQGRLQMEQWTARDGTKRSKLSLRAFEVQFIGRKGDPGLEREFEDPEETRPSGRSRPTPSSLPAQPCDDDEDIIPF